MDELKGKIALVTGASMGIGEAISIVLAKAGCRLALLSRSKDKLDAVSARILSESPNVQVRAYAVDIRSHSDVDSTVQRVVAELGEIDILINNAGLALGAPARFWEQPIGLIDQMNNTNISGVMYTAHSVLNRSMWPRKTGTIVNISSVTGLECPPFDGEAVYHANKACIEGFSNALRSETAGSDIRVLVLRPGCVATHFHLQRVKYDSDAMDEFFAGYEPLVAEDLADSLLFMLSRVGRVSIKALDCVPTAQRSLTRIDRTWNERLG
ncbi:putative NADP-dependent dehydrogenase [Rosellinia necatrix]|uniref:Putative NADP-dependent dehydrogenase n=1 Tax=Rosellinia necatrix TaxID=77044 RepID=A0A1W2TX10_ROSNE|nr:putative NADP-dependent dehydrogenase [Rosellinia necatrix]